MEHFMNKIDVRETPAVIADSGKIRIGDVSPAFPPARGRPGNISDTGKVRIGDLSPSFAPPRSK
jgi:hypothetical protein